ncbi:hypothetical protein CGMCC3_g8322 [Colletotrichum fructicola]|nr:uncharacterized protein CGMCC3_g8322 [Colletotrichum fructicola]KAE9575550.1 hypothetical protein CGMCC3_g8322 [Colletotrichum fructicola]
MIPPRLAFSAAVIGSAVDSFVKLSGYQWENMMLRMKDIVGAGSKISCRI